MNPTSSSCDTGLLGFLNEVVKPKSVAIGRGLMSLPSLIMFDEPSLGLAPILAQEIFHVVRRIRDEGATVLIVGQNVCQTLTAAGRAYVLETGKVRMQGAGRDLLGDPHVKAAYLGLS